MSEALLEGLLVLDMSQFLSGPFAALRLADLQPPDPQPLPHA